MKLLNLDFQFYPNDASLLTFIDYMASFRFAKKIIYPPIPSSFCNQSKQILNIFFVAL